MENGNFFVFRSFTANTEIIIVQHIPLVVQCTYACAWQARRLSGIRVRQERIIRVQHGGFPTHVSLQSCGAAVRGRNYDLHLHVPGSLYAIPRGSRVQYQPPFLHCVLCSGTRWLWQQVFLLVSASFICSCACVGLLYRSSICACVTFILFVFREQKMVQQMQEIVAKYEDRLRKIQSVRDYRTDDV